MRDVITDHKKRNPLNPVTVITPSTYTGIYLRQELSRKGFANIRFMTLPRLADLLGSPRAISNGQLPLSSTEDIFQTMSALELSDTPLKKFTLDAAIVNGVRKVFAQFNQLSKKDLSLMEERVAVPNWLGSMYRQYKGNTQNYYTREEINFWAATDVEEGKSQALKDIGHVIFYLLRKASPGEEALIHALSNTSKCSVILPTTKPESPDIDTISLRKALSRSLELTLMEFPEQVPASLQLEILPNPDLEVSGVVRHLLEAASKGISFGKMACLYPVTNPYYNLLKRELQLANIPIAGPNLDNIGKSAIGRSFVQLMKLSEANLERKAVISWAAQCPVDPFKQKLSSFKPNKWDDITKRAGIIRGRSQWLSRLEIYLDGIEKSPRNKFDKDEALDVRNLQTFISGLAESLQLPEGPQSWSAYFNWAQNLLDEYLPTTDDLNLDAIQTREKIVDILREFQENDSPKTSPTFRKFLLSIEESLKQAHGHMGNTGEGVFIAPFGYSNGMEFETTYILGMTDSNFSEAKQTNPFINAEVLENFEDTKDLYTRLSSDQNDYQFAFDSICISNKNVTFSHPLTNIGSEVENYPSKQYMQVARQLENAPVYNSDLTSLGARDWMNISVSSTQIIKKSQIDYLKDKHEYDFRHLLDWSEAGNSLAEHPLAQQDHLPNSISQSRSRYQKALTVWDGNISTTNQGYEALERPIKSVLSATSMETWAKCPYKYFLGNILGIESIEPPEEIISLSARDKGTLIHTILEKFYKDATKDKIPMPSANIPWDNEARQLITEISETEFVKIEGLGITGNALVWQVEKSNIALDLQLFLKEDSDLRKRFNVSNIKTEAQFGNDESDWDKVEVVLQNGKTLKFRGFIDRIDSNESLSKYLVIDYKSGSTSAYRAINKDVLDGGTRLQLPIYILAVSANTNPNSEIFASYWFISSKGKFTLIPSNPKPYDSFKDQFLRAIEIISDSINSGIFPANPGKANSNCTYCDFDNICHSRRAVLWDRKRNDDQLQNYISLAQ